MDYTSALSIKSSSESKVYIVLFTCMITCAIQMELVDANSFLRAFKRDCGRRPYPTLLLTDNSTYFTKVARGLSENMDSFDVAEYMSGVKCQWRLIPASGPWFSAIWNRCIEIIKMGVEKRP